MPRQTAPINCIWMYMLNLHIFPLYAGFRELDWGGGAVVEYKLYSVTLRQLVQAVFLLRNAVMLFITGGLIDISVLFSLAEARILAVLNILATSPFIVLLICLFCS